MPGLIIVPPMILQSSYELVIKGGHEGYNEPTLSFLLR